MHLENEMGFVLPRGDQGSQFALLMKSLYQSHLILQPAAWRVSSISEESKNLMGASNFTFLIRIQQDLSASSKPSLVQLVR